MKTWNYGLNSHPDHRIGTITLYDRPWWLSVVEWFAFAIGWRWLDKIPLPNWPLVAWTEDPEDKCSPRDWWGDVGQMVCSHVTTPLFQWVWAHPRNRKIEVKLGYDRLREILYESDHETFDREEAIYE